MVATVKIYEWNGTSGSQTFTDKTSGTVTFSSGDHSIPTSAQYPVVPTSGTEYSFKKYLQANVTVAPDTNITNLNAYMDGASSYGTGVTIYGKASAAYATPAKASTTAGYADMFTYTSGSPLSLGAGPFTGTGGKGDFLECFLTCTSASSAGNQGSETLTISYDET